MENADVQHFDDWRAKLGREVRDCRKRLGWDQVTLAKKATPILYPSMDKRISTETISRVENGGNITTETLNAIAVALDVEVRVKLRPIDKPGAPATNPSEPEPAPRRTPPSAEQVRALLADIPPPGEAVANGEMGSSDTAERLARLGADLLEIIEDLGTGRQTPMARGSRPESTASHRQDRGRKDRSRAPKTAPKRR